MSCKDIIILTFTTTKDVAILSFAKIRSAYGSTSNVHCGIAIYTRLLTTAINAMLNGSGTFYVQSYQSCYSAEVYKRFFCIEIIFSIHIKYCWVTCGECFTTKGCLISPCISCTGTAILWCRSNNTSIDINRWSRLVFVINGHLGDARRVTSAKG